MPKLKIFTEESRDQILKSVTNHSKSKQAWSFSRQKRFAEKHANCPYVSYAENISTLSNKKPAFPTSQRKVFTESSQAPTSWVYHPEEPRKNSTISFAQGRQEIVAHSYIDHEKVKNPGPANYVHEERSRKGYTMRPKTAKSRIYFVQNKEQAEVPGPGKYDNDPIRIVGKNLVSKFRSAVSGYLSKQKRFKSNRPLTPSVWSYKKQFSSRIRGGKMGKQLRESFIDTAMFNSTSPGPGNYKLPTQFGHYKKVKLFL